MNPAPQPEMYETLTEWYRLLDPVEHHADEAQVFHAAFQRATHGTARTLLELGAGAGHNAWHLKAHYQCTLADVSEAMLVLSRELNPECEHIMGDMRTLRLGRVFDALLVHDAVAYMTTEADLQAAIETTFAHTRPGGSAIIAPDGVKETYADGTELIENQDGNRHLRCVEWDWDPNPEDTWHYTDYIFMMRQGEDLQVVTDRHTIGIFPTPTWLRLLAQAGFEVEMMQRPIGDGETDEVFLCRRPPS